MAGAGTAVAIAVAPDPALKDAAGAALYDADVARTGIADRRPIAAIATDPDGGAVLGGL